MTQNHLEEREDGWTWEEVLRFRGYSEEVIRELAAKRALKAAFVDELHISE